MNISTRGSADSLIVALVLFTIFFYQQVSSRLTILFIYSVLQCWCLVSLCALPTFHGSAGNRHIVCWYEYIAWGHSHLLFLPKFCSYVFFLRLLPCLHIVFFIFFSVFLIFFASIFHVHPPFSAKSEFYAAFNYLFSHLVLFIYFTSPFSSFLAPFSPFLSSPAPARRPPRGGGRGELGG